MLYNRAEPIMALNVVRGGLSTSVRVPVGRARYGASQVAALFSSARSLRHAASLAGGTTFSDSTRQPSRVWRRACTAFLLDTQNTVSRSCKARPRGSSSSYAAAVGAAAAAPPPRRRPAAAAVIAVTVAAAERAPCRMRRAVAGTSRSEPSIVATTAATCTAPIGPGAWGPQRRAAQHRLPPPRVHAQPGQKAAVGCGARAFRAASACLQRWGHFQLGWTGVDPATPTRPGTLLAVTSRTLFLWSANPLKVVSGSVCSRRSRMPSVTTSIRVALLTWRDTDIGDRR
ncbi:hypothetical protein TSOC_004767 [Tetrabaena socialis]|uniref:DUF1990 domain-containing protein n=1 Tax=Tetrabaena socialis TaxID=47790 RepID=A0A2J8A7Z6_9CHLO|nr:hypothetical protein TSOC_004767 [Tetrabaena socialis]|eukprot:PNH08654.1 hypothetical protein TSOC_004767 [Tetrabaena socialis]